MRRACSRRPTSRSSLLAAHCWRDSRWTRKAPDEVIPGCANPSPDEVNIGRYRHARLGCGDKVTGWTVMRNCATRGVDSAINNMLAGRSEIVLAGGVDALPRAAALQREDGAVVRRLPARAPWAAAVWHLRKRSPAALLSPVIALMKGLTDPKVGLLMGQTPRIVASASPAPKWMRSLPKPQAGAFSPPRRRADSRTKWCR